MVDVVLELGLFVAVAVAVTLTLAGVCAIMPAVRWTLEAHRDFIYWGLACGFAVVYVVQRLKEGQGDAE